MSEIPGRNLYEASRQAIIEFGNAIVKKQAPSLSQAREALVELVAGVQCEAAKEARVALDAFGKVLTVHQKLLWSRGWMVDEKCPLVAINKGAEKEDGTWDHDQVDQWMLEYFQENIAKHQQLLLNTWPDRAEALQEIFDLAASGKFRGAIAALLPMVDYISQQRAGAKFFNLTHMKGGKMVSTAYKALIESANVSRVLEVLCEYSPVYCIQDGRKKGIINRHDVLHGDDDTYGTEMNYFRCLSIAVSLTTFANPKKASSFGKEPAD
jgi:hypothetical protein